MHRLFKGVTAGAASLLAMTGVGLVAATPASAISGTCTISADSPSVAEGNTGASTPGVITLTATASNAGACNNVVVNYTFSGGTATNGTDYTGTDGSTSALSSGTSQTVTIPFTVTGDNVDEPDETIVVSLSSSGATVPSTATATITDDDAPTGIGTGGTATIDPTSGPAGTVITVTGTQCNEATGSAALAKVSGGSADVVATSSDATVTGGTLTAHITVPSGLDPAATYSVGASCGDTSTTGQSYSPVPFDVTASSTPATPSTNKPTGSSGYREVAADGGIFTFGDRVFRGSTGDIKLNSPIVGGATDKATYDGYWIVAADGGVFNFNAPFFGSLGDQKLASPATEIEPTPTGQGYWIVLANGKVYTFGDAQFFGDMSTSKLNGTVIGMSVTPDGKGYWLVGSDGGIFNFGDAGFFGSMGDKKLNKPIIDLAPSADNNGYYLLGADGGVFTFGSADFKGSTGDIKLNAPVVAMLVNPAGSGYWLAATDGGLFSFGAVDYLGSMGGTPLNSPVLDLIN